MTAYRNLASDLVTSMQADLYRVGFADSGQFRALSDSVWTTSAAAPERRPGQSHPR